MQVGTTLTVTKNCTDFRFKDSLNYTGTTPSVTSYNIEIYTPKSENPIIINGISLYADNDTTRELIVTPANLNQTEDYLEDGIYSIVVKITQTGGTVSTKSLNSRVSCQLKKCLLPKIAKLPVSNDDCNTCSENKKQDTDTVLIMFAQLDAVDAQIECGTLSRAQEMFDDISKACDNCNNCCQ